MWMRDTIGEAWAVNTFTAPGPPSLPLEGDEQTRLLGLVVDRDSVIRVMVGRGFDTPIEAMDLIIGTGGKEEHVRRLVRDAIAETDPPQPINGHLLTVGMVEPAAELAGGEIIGIDRTIPEVADE